MRLIPGPFSYGYPVESKDPYSLAFVSIDGDEAFRWYRRITHAFGHILRFNEQHELAPLLLDIVHRNDPTSASDRYMQSSRLYHLLMVVYSLQNRSRMLTHPRTAMAMELIHDRAANPVFNVNALADELGCSREHFSRLFREAIGISPSNYLLQYRLKLAARLLRGNDDKLERIARQSGFSSANYLCRVFKQQMGVTCAAFRAQPWIAGP
jgi:AraC-like DNA-binding protein